MTAVQFIPKSAISRVAFTQYLTDIATFQAALRVDFLSTLGASFEVLATAAAPTVAILVTPNSGPVLTVPLNSWVGCPNGTWTVLPPASMGRTVTDVVTTDASATVTSATASFQTADVGAVLATVKLPIGTTIVSRESSTSVTVSANALSAGTAQTATITRVTDQFTPVVL